MLLQGNHTTSKGRSREKEAAKVNKFQSLERHKSLDLHSLDTPTVGALVADAGKEGDLILLGPPQHGGIRFLYLAHTNYGVGFGTGLGGEGDAVSNQQRVDLSKVAVGATIVSGDTDISLPDRGVLEVARTLGESFAIRALVDLHIYPQAGNLDPAKIIPGVIHIPGYLSIAVGGGDRLHHNAGASSIGRRRRAEGIGQRDHSGVESSLRDCVGSEEGVQRLAAAGEVAAIAPESRGNEGGILAQIHVGLFTPVSRDDRLH